MVTNPHILNLDHNNSNIPARHKISPPPRLPTTTAVRAGSAAVGVVAILPEELDALLERVILNVQLAKVFLLLGPGLRYPRGAPYGRADAADRGGVEVEEDGGEGGLWRCGGAAGGAAGVRERAVGDPYVLSSISLFIYHGRDFWGTNSRGRGSRRWGWRGCWSSCERTGSMS